MESPIGWRVCSQATSRYATARKSRPSYSKVFATKDEAEAEKLRQLDLFGDAVIGHVQPVSIAKTVSRRKAKTGRVE